MKTAIILASNSPRRRDLLRQVGLVFQSDPANVDERMQPGEQPEAYARRVALDKARMTAGRATSGIVVAADTVVVLDTQVLGKPVDADDAKRMLLLLSGRAHRVITAVAMIDIAAQRTLVRESVTSVNFRKLSPAQIAAYVATGEPLDKAGAYGIQEKGAVFIDRIEGCYSNVVGLPLGLLAEMLEMFGVQLF